MSLRIIGGQFKNRPLKSPTASVTRPTTSMLRKAVFDICRPLIEEGAFLDIFAGTGAMGLEAISRHAATATFIEQDVKAIRCIQDNIQLLGVAKQCTVVKSDALSYLKKLEKSKAQFDVIYVDPPYDTTIYAAILAILDQSTLLKPQGMVFIEEALPSTLKPETLSLTTLKHDKTRRYGKAALHEFSHTSSRKNYIMNLSQ